MWLNCKTAKTKAIDSFILQTMHLFCSIFGYAETPSKNCITQFNSIEHLIKYSKATKTTATTTKIRQQSKYRQINRHKRLLWMRDVSSVESIHSESITVYRSPIGNVDIRYITQPQWIRALTPMPIGNHCCCIGVTFRVRHFFVDRSMGVRAKHIESSPFTSMPVCHRHSISMLFSMLHLNKPFGGITGDWPFIQFGFILNASMLLFIRFSVLK